MAVFEYKALNAHGRNTKGIIDAENIRAARQKLKKQGIFPTELSETGQKPVSVSRDVGVIFRDRKVPAAQLALATQQLATLLGSGIPLVDSLKALGEQLDQPRLKSVFAEVCDRVNEGSTLADAMKAYPKVFPHLYSNMIASGEMSGTLDIVLKKLAELLENQAGLQRKVISAILYPVIILVVCFLLVILLLTTIVPQISKMFEDAKATLPLPTQIVVACSDFFLEHWLLLFVATVISWFAFRQYAKTATGKVRLHRLALKVPLFGNLILKVATARFTRTLGTMLNSGIELLTALSISRNIVGNVILEEYVDRAREGVKEGRSLAAELAKGGFFPRMAIHMIAVGEKTGQLEPMLLRAGESYEGEVQAIVSNITSVLGPILVLVLAVIVCFILLAVLMPMMEMSDLVG